MTKLKPIRWSTTWPKNLLRPIICGKQIDIIIAPEQVSKTSGITFEVSRRVSPRVQWFARPGGKSCIPVHLAYRPIGWVADCGIWTWMYLCFVQVAMMKTLNIMLPYLTLYVKTFFLELVFFPIVINSVLHRPTQYDPKNKVCYSGCNTSLTSHPVIPNIAKVNIN